MNPLKSLLSEVKLLAHLLGVPPARPLPREVRVSNVPPSVHVKSSLSGDELLISGELDLSDELLLRKEAFSLFIPEEADDIPQVHGMSWFYARASRKVWNRFREKPPPPFETFDLFDYLERLEGAQGLKELLMMVRAAAMSGELTFPVFTALVRRCTMKPHRPTKSQLAILKELAKRPTADIKELSSRTGVPYSTLWKALSSLREEDLISGPENVDIGMLGLDTYVISYPNVKEFREAFWEFPFTYNQLIPLNGARVHAFVLAPTKALIALSSLEEFGMEVGRVTMVAQSFNLSYRDEEVGEMLKRALTERYTFRRNEQRGSPYLKLREDDLKVLNQILLYGTTSSSKLKALGVKSAKRRLAKLRNLGLIKRYYTVGSPPGTRVLVVKASCSETEVGRVFSLFRSAPEVQVAHVSSREEFCLAVIHAYPGTVERFVAAAKLFLGDRLRFAGEVYDVVTSWTLPVELWVPRKGFNWEEPLEDLKGKLGPISMKATGFSDKG